MTIFAIKGLQANYCRLVYCSVKSVLSAWRQHICFNSTPWIMWQYEGIGPPSVRADMAETQN